MEIQSRVQPYNESNIDMTQQTLKWSRDNGDETSFDQLLGQIGSTLVTWLYKPHKVEKPAKANQRRVKR